MESMGIMVNTTGCDEHVSEIEREIRTIQERVWEIVKTLH